MLPKFAWGSSERKLEVEAWLERVCQQENMRIGQLCQQVQQECMCHAASRCPCTLSGRDENCTPRSSVHREVSQLSRPLLHTLRLVNKSLSCILQVFFKVQLLCCLYRMVCCDVSLMERNPFLSVLPDLPEKCPLIFEILSYVPVITGAHKIQ